MRLFSLTFLIVTIISCTGTGSQNPTSLWVELGNAEKVSCEPFPKPEKAVSIKDIKLVEGKNVAFVTEYAMRNGANGRFIAGFKGDEELQASELEPRIFGDGSMIAGGVTVFGRLYVAVVQHVKKSYVLELRDLDANVVKYSVALSANKIQRPVVHQIAGHKTFWISYSEANEEVGVEDASLGFAQFTLPKDRKDKAVKQTFVTAGQPNGSALVPIEDEQFRALVVWGEKTGKEAKSFKFFMKGLTENTKQNLPAKELELPIDASVESWSVQAAKKGFFISVIDGDSMVGQANLKVARVYWQDGYQKMAWSKTRSLLNEHVSEPSWVRFQNRQYLVVPKWLDNESTMAIYAVTDTEIENSKATGIFPNSLRLMSLFTNVGQDELFGVIRYKGKTGNIFEVCNLGKP